MDNLNIQYIERFAVQLVGYKIWAIDEFAIAQCYLIEGDTQAVLIDTGLGQGDLRSVVDRLTDKPYIIINTHGHSDHIGGNDEFSDHSIYMHMQDDCISHLENLSEEERLKSFKKSFNEPGFYGKKEYDMSRQYRKFTYSNVCEGQVFDLGGRTLEVIATPGHTRGSIVLFDMRLLLAIFFTCIRRRQLYTDLGCGLLYVRRGGFACCCLLQSLF